MTTYRDRREEAVNLFEQLTDMQREALLRDLLKRTLARNVRHNTDDPQSVARPVLRVVRSEPESSPRDDGRLKRLGRTITKGDRNR